MDKHLRPCLVEMIGVFLLCFLGAGAACTDAVTGGRIGVLGVALAYGMAMALGVTAALNISGGHLNPAVTITKWVLGKIDTMQMLYYIAAQLLGGLIGGAFIALIFGASGAALEAGLGAPHIQATITTTGYQRILMAGLIEALLTFVLVYAMFATMFDPRAPKVAGFGAGLAVVVGVLVAGPLTGAAMNPARYLGVAVWEGGIRGFSSMNDFTVYIAGPILGGIAAGWIYTGYILPKEPAKTETGRQGK
jgi:MIP family channel proteins